MPKLHSLLYAVLLAAAALPAQSGVRLLGLTATTSRLQSQDPLTCAPSSCFPAAFPPSTLPCAGGTAYDTRSRGTWNTDGVTLAKVDSRALCTYQCPLTNIAAVVPNGAYATGLAFFHRESQGYLLITDSLNRINFVEIVDQPCTFRTPSFRCNVVVPPQNMLTGVAVDDVNDLVYYTWASCSPTANGGTLAVARLATFCTPICTFQVQSCGGNALRALSGVAFDACQDAVWVTDGVRLASFRVDATACTIQPLGCCANPTPSEPYVGLCIESSTEAAVGAPCSAFACPACSPAIAMLTGDPVIGNVQFTIDGVGLPASSAAGVLIDFGPCAAPGFLPPAFCGPLLLPLTPALFAVNAPTGGTAGCDGSVHLTLSIPMVRPMCGLVVSTQILGICFPPTGGVGTFATPCLSWRITSS